ncbi:MAG: PKD domain-containing protein [Thermoleophilaceae bacterium]
MTYPRKLALLLPLCIAAALALPALAQADTYCVGPSLTGCTATADTVQHALDAANSTPAEDTVKIGPGTYTAATGTSFSYPFFSAGGVVHIIGSGSSTVLTTDGTTTHVLVVGSPPNGSSVANLAVRVPSTQLTGMTGILMSAGSVDNVSVTSEPGLDAPVGITLDGSSLRHSSVDVSNAASGGTAVTNVGGITALLEDDVLKGATGLESHFLANAYRLDVTANHGISAFAETVCESCLIRLSGSNARGARVDPGGGGIVLRLSTIVGEGPGSIGVDADAGGTNHSMSVNVDGTIIRGPELSMHRDEAGGIVNLFGDYNDYETVRDDSTSSNGVLDPGAHSTTADPKFVDPASGDYRLRGDSPAIDATGIAATPDENTDLAGNPRKVGPTWDMGAFEYLRRAPSGVTASATSPVFVGQASMFSASGSDPDGDPLTYTWAFDDGGTTSGASVQHAFATPGVHTATVTAHDPTGQTASGGTSTTVMALPPQVTVPLVPPTILNTFTFAKVKVDTKHGWVILVLNLPGAGKIDVLGTATQPSHKLVAAKSKKKKKKAKKFTAVKKSATATKAGPLTITLKLGSKAMTLLKQNHSLKVPLKITFTPAGGTAHVQSKTVTFKLEKPKKKKR